ncbi:hypothetical protein ABS71_12955 [bacterium SCN 62-11]|nr:hypothetical protein [Candidatus Eremiobacteraeota bacterium]ODT64655.1 MAG: hypothetical protein ABS71_12955 [bacterium SCN 62-11]
MLNNSFMDWGLDIGRLFGTRVRIHWIFFIFVLFRLMRADDKQMELIYLLVLFLTVLVHEFGHIFAARHFQLRAEKIVLWPCGGLAFVGAGGSAWEEFWIAFFGPFTQIVLGACAAGWLYFHGGAFQFVADPLMPVMAVPGSASMVDLVVAIIFSVQVWLFAFNVLLPAYPLDGGRMLVALVLNKVGALKASGMAMVLTLISAAYLLSRSDSMLGFFLMIEAAMLYQMRQTGDIFSHPSFSTGSRPLYGNKAKKSAAKPKKTKQVSHLRLVDSKQCPQCGRSLPTTAKMCGFCEISV